MLEEFSSDPVNEARPLLIEAASEITDAGAYEHFLDERLLVEDAIAASHRHDTDSDVWTFAKGDYRHAFAGESHGNEDPLLTDPISGIEEMWSDQIDSLLRERQSSGRPVILMDFGGGAGHSVIRVAAQEKYRDAIANGDLAFVVTNLGYVPPSSQDQDGYTGVARSMNATNHADPAVFRYITHYTPDELAFVQANQAKVTYLDANALELANTTIATPDGRVTPLKGSVGVIHEDNAIMHTHVPDVALAVFDELLIPNGTLYLDARRGNYMHGPQVDKITVADGRILQLDLGPGQAYYEARQTALDVGVRALAKRGFVLHEGPEPYGPATYVKEASSE